MWQLRNLFHFDITVWIFDIANKETNTSCVNNARLDFKCTPCESRDACIVNFNNTGFFKGSDCCYIAGFVVVPNVAFE